MHAPPPQFLPLLPQLLGSQLSELVHPPPLLAPVLDAVPEELTEDDDTPPDDVLLDVLDDVLEDCTPLDAIPDVAPPLAELPPTLLLGFPDVTPPEDDDDVDDDVEELDDDEDDDDDTSPEEDDDEEELLPKQPAPLQATSTMAFPARKHPPSGRVTRDRTRAFQGRLSMPAT